MARHFQVKFDLQDEYQAAVCETVDRLPKGVRQMLFLRLFATQFGGTPDAEVLFHAMQEFLYRPGASPDAPSKVASAKATSKGPQGGAPTATALNESDSRRAKQSSDVAARQQGEAMASGPRTQTAHDVQACQLCGNKAKAAPALAPYSLSAVPWRRD